MSHPGMVNQREMPLKEFVGTLPHPHIARDDYEMLINIYKAAQRFFAELQEDAEGIPQRELLNVNTAIDAYEGREYLRRHLPGFKITQEFEV